MLTVSRPKTFMKNVSTGCVMVTRSCWLLYTAVGSDTASAGTTVAPLALLNPFSAAASMASLNAFA